MFFNAQKNYSPKESSDFDNPPPAAWVVSELQIRVSATVSSYVCRALTVVLIQLKLFSWSRRTRFYCSEAINGIRILKSVRFVSSRHYRIKCMILVKKKFKKLTINFVQYCSKLHKDNVWDLEKLKTTILKHF